MKKNRWLWASIFIFAVFLLIVLATFWNVLAHRIYHHWFAFFAGSLGFIGAFASILMLFIRLLREMKLNQLQIEFLARMTHEFKTPLTTLELTSSLLKTMSPSQEAEPLWKAHDQELRRLKQEVDTLLEASRWESQPRRRIHLEPVDGELWLQSVLEKQDQMRVPGQPVLKWERVGDHFSGQLLLSKELMDLVMNNLFDNIRKFAKDSGPLLLIRLKIRPDQKKWKLQLVDQGWGFDSKNHKKIFQRFYRAPSGAPHAVPGTGLGLYLARQACQAMGIELMASSPGLGQGCVYELTGGYVKA